MKISNFKFQIWGIFLFILFITFSILISLDALSNIDFDTTVRIQNKIPDFLITPFSVFSLLGTVETASVILLVLWLFIPKLRKFTVLILYAMIGLIEIIGKSIIGQIGPPIAFLKTDLHFNFPSNYIPHEFFSYPSGHSARTAFISGILIFAILFARKLSKKQKQLTILGILFFDFLMFLSRVYLGEHWFSDVIGGALLGFSLAFMALSLKSLKFQKS